MNDRLQRRLLKLLDGLDLGADGIWSGVISPCGQEEERNLREKVAAKYYDNYLKGIAKHHSIPVMDHEVRRFLDKVGQDAVILDVGGCWGWHWRKLSKQRTDVCVVIVDFVRNNLHHAQNILGTLVGNQVVLVHADATMLPFPDEAFDGFWTVQTFQHIPDFPRACREAHRVLKKGGVLANYSLNIVPTVRLASHLLGRPYHVEGKVENLFHLTRANDTQRNILSSIFGVEAKNRYTEYLFHPDLKLTFTGRERSWIGMLDAYLGDLSLFGQLLARQRSFELVKPRSRETKPV